MLRVLGIRLLSRLLVLVCSISLLSLLFLSRCGFNNIDTDIVDTAGEFALHCAFDKAYTIETTHHWQVLITNFINLIKMFHFMKNLFDGSSIISWSPFKSQSWWKTSACHALFPKYSSSKTDHKTAISNRQNFVKWPKSLEVENSLGQDPAFGCQKVEKQLVRDVFAHELELFKDPCRTL